MEDQRINLLLVEDNLGDARLLRELLSEVRVPCFKVTHVESLEAGLASLDQDSFDIVLFDLSLPDGWGLDGIQAAQLKTPDLPIIVLTGLDDEATALEAMQRGAQDYLLKGQMDPGLIVRAIRYAIERKRAERERQWLQHRTREQADLVMRILDAVQEGILTLNADREVVLANPAAIEYLTVLAGIGAGQELENLGGYSIQAVLGCADDPLPLEVEVPEGGQRIFEIHVNASSLGVEEGGWTLLIREVTELRRVQDKANQQDRLAAVGQLASGIAHDFNNIMGAILLYSEMILDRVEMGEKDRGRMRTIMDQAQRAASLTRQILDFSSGGLMEPHLFDLAPFVEEMRALLERTLPENIRIIVDEKGEGYIVNADPVQLRQVFMNLALNARDAMEGGGELRIRLRKRRFGEGNPPPSREMGAGEWLCVTVADTGSGIPANLLPHVFEPFFTTKEPGEGSGLGLPQVYGIVKQHGGSVEIESEIGQGTSVHVYLPARAGTVQTDLIVEEEPVNQPVKGTVVVVEDDPPTRRAIGDVLQMEGYRVLLASDGSEAIEQLERHNGRIDMVVSDLVMPGIGGMALLRQLGKDYPEVKVMLMTGHPLGPATRKLLQERGVRWLAKPVRSESLLAAVAGALSNGNPTRA